jgi:hypothetical protein
MKCLIIIFGESFRTGSQGTRIKGRQESYDEQIKASNSHIDFFKFLEGKYNLDISVSLLSYQTIFDKDLENIYSKYIIKYESLNNMIGLNGIFHRSYSKIDINNYNFILYIRVDLYLKKYFYKIFNPYWNTIRFATILWTKYRPCGDYPPINDMIIFIPKIYFNYLPKFDLTWHGAWKSLIEGGLQLNDLDTMLNTFHDSDSEKDLNPLYYIVNRPRQTIWYDKNLIFNKYIFPKSNSFNNNYIYYIVLFIAVLFILIKKII